MASEGDSAMAATVRGLLEAQFEPVYLTVEDESDGCGDKISIVLVSAKFDGVALLERQRAVNDCLKEPLKTIHALSMKTWTPAQGEKKGVIAGGETKEAS